MTIIEQALTLKDYLAGIHHEIHENPAVHSLVVELDLCIRYDPPDTLSDSFIRLLLVFGVLYIIQDIPERLVCLVLPEIVIEMFGTEIHKFPVRLDRKFDR